MLYTDLSFDIFLCWGGNTNIYNIYQNVILVSKLSRNCPFYVFMFEKLGYFTLEKQHFEPLTW